MRSPSGSWVTAAGTCVSRRNSRIDWLTDNRRGSRNGSMSSDGRGTAILLILGHKVDRTASSIDRRGRRGIAFIYVVLFDVHDMLGS